MREEEENESFPSPALALSLSLSLSPALFLREKAEKKTTHPPGVLDVDPVHVHQDVPDHLHRLLVPVPRALEFSQQRVARGFFDGVGNAREVRRDGRDESVVEAAAALVDDHVVGVSVFFFLSTSFVVIEGAVFRESEERGAVRAKGDDDEDEKRRRKR